MKSSMTFIQSNWWTEIDLILKQIWRRFIWWQVRFKYAIGGRCWYIATQERKLSYMKIEIVTYVINGSVKLTVPPIVKTSKLKINKLYGGLIVCIFVLTQMNLEGVVKLTISYFSQKSYTLLTPGRKTSSCQYQTLQIIWIYFPFTLKVYKMAISFTLTTEEVYSKRQKSMLYWQNPSSCVSFYSFGTSHGK